MGFFVGCCETNTLFSPIIHGSWKMAIYLKGNYYWRDSFLTSMIMGGSVVRLLYNDVKMVYIGIFHSPKLRAQKPLKKKQKETRNFQPSIFRCELLVCVRGTQIYFHNLRFVNSKPESCEGF